MAESNGDSGEGNRPKDLEGIGSAADGSNLPDASVDSVTEDKGSAANGVGRLEASVNSVDASVDSVTKDERSATNGVGHLDASVDSVGSVPSDLTINSYDIRRSLEGTDLNLGTESEVARDLFDRSDEILDDVQPQKMSRLQSEWWTDRPDSAVRIRYKETGEAAEPTETILEMFERIVTGYGEHTALAVKRLGEWKKWTYKKYHEESMIAAKAMIELGLKPYHSVCILGFNAPEWHISSMAAIMACGIPVGLYLTSTPEACCTIAENCKANIVVVENESQLQKILQIRDRLPDLKAIIQYTKEVTEKEDSVHIMDWQHFMMLGMRTPDKRLQERMAQIQANKCCTIIYTSGTSGEPKGVMLSHDNITWMCRRVMSETHCTTGEEHVVSYLPLSHVATQLLDIYTAMVSAGTCWFAQPDALKGSLLQTMKEVHPTIFLGVPRVWEKIAESMQAVARNTRGLKAKIASWAKGVGLKGNFRRQMGGTGTPFGWTLANIVFFKKVREALGFDRLHFPMSGAAPLAEDTLTYFMSINIPLHEIYGLSECSGPTTVTTIDKIRFRSSGKPTEGIDLMIEDPDEDGSGEVLIRGRHVFMGYLNHPEITRQVLTEEGWLRSGDIGKISSEGFLFITGRKKELIITSSGEKVAPVPIENSIKHELPIVANAMVIGDKQKFLSCLLTLKVEVDDSTGLPMGQLTPVAVAACQRVGSHSLTVTDILVGGGDHKVLKMIQKGVDNVNRRALSRAQKIAKWSILERDFSVASGELTPTLKLKRKDIMLKYADCIDSFYSS